MTQVVEGAPYEGLMALIENEPPPPNNDKRIKAAKEYPVTVRIHINDRADCDKFAELLGCDLSSDQTKITFNKNAKRKAGATYTEIRTHLSDSEAGSDQP